MADFANIPAPQQYAPKENLGLTLLGGLGQVAAAYTGANAAQSNKEFQTAFGQAYAKGDYNAMQQLAVNHPEQWQQVQQGLGVIQQNNRDQLGAASSDISLAAASGNPQAVYNVAQQHAQTLQGLGISPDDLATAYQQNPQQVRQYADMLGSHALGPEQYFTNQNKMLERIQQGAYQQGQLQLGQQRTQIQQQQANTQAQQVAQQAAYQQSQAQQGWQRLNQEAEFNKAKVMDMQLNRQIQQGKNAADIAKQQQANLQTKQGLVDAFDQTSNQISGMLSTLGQVQNIPPETFNATFGISGKINRNIPGSAEGDAWNQIQQMQAQARQMGVISMKGTGPVSDAEGKAAADAFLALDPTTSPAAARRAINNWNTVLQRQAAYQQKRQPQIDIYRNQLQQNQQQQSQQLQGSSNTVDWNSLN